MFEFFLEVPGSMGCDFLRCEESWTLAGIAREMEARVHADRLGRSERAGNPGRESLTLVIFRLPVGAMERRTGSRCDIGG